MNPPFHRSYWAIPKKLLAGCYPGDLDSAEMDAKLSGLLGVGVTLVVNLMEEAEADHSGNPFNDYAVRLTALAKMAGKPIRLERFPIRDQSIPTLSQMEEIIEAVEREIAADGVVYVHCWGGKGRTATAVGCYLLSRKLETPATVLGSCGS